MTMHEKSQYRKLKKLNSNVWGNIKALKYRANARVLSNSNISTLFSNSKNVNDSRLVQILKCKQDKLKLNKIKLIKKISPYGERLIEKQKLKIFYYNMNENTLARYHTIAKNKTYFEKKNTFDNYLIELLETRLDTILFRSKLCETILSARATINHGHVSVNNIIIFDKSYKIKLYDSITIHYEKNKLQNYIKYMKDSHHISLEIPPYLEVNYKLLKCVLVEQPMFNNIEYPINIDFEKIRELYR